jgi:hypothetical protein
MTTDDLTPRAKRLLVMAMVIPWLCVIVMLVTPMLNSQTRHLRAAEKHIEKVTPQWENFRATHPGFEKVQLFAYTGGDGMFGASGEVASDEKLSELRKFMESTSPPRPVYIGAVLWPGWSGPADVSQTNNLETNHIPPQ